MSARSLNKVLLIGNLTADPELRYTPQGTAVCTFSIATNRSWTDQAGQQQEEVEFSRCVAWGKRADICSQLLFKGRKAYVEGRLQTREWEAQDHTKRRTTEIVVENIIALGAPQSASEAPAVHTPSPTPSVASEPKQGKSSKKSSEEKVQEQRAEDELVAAEDIPF